jgi:hypothetical protein
MDESPMSDGPPELWAALRRRQERLPLGRLDRRSDWRAISLNEQREVRRLASRYGLSEAQRFSLFERHHGEVHRRAAAAAPDVVRPPGPRANAASGHVRVARRRRRVIPRGWVTWLGNRRVSGRASWLRVTARLG